MSLEYFWHNFWAFFFGTAYYPKLILYFPCLRPGISHFSKELWKMLFKIHQLGTKVCLLVPVSLFLGLFSTQTKHISVSGSVFLCKKSWVHIAVFKSCSKIGFILAFSLSSVSFYDSQKFDSIHSIFSYVFAQS